MRSACRFAADIIRNTQRAPPNACRFAADVIGNDNKEDGMNGDKNGTGGREEK